VTINNHQDLPEETTKPPQYHIHFMPPFCILRNKTTKATVLAFTLLGRSSVYTTTQAFSILAQPLASHRPSFSVLHLSSSTFEMPKKRVLVPISDGSEEIETCCITDTLTRFGADVVIASVKPDGELKCVMSRGIQVSQNGSFFSSLFCFFFSILKLPSVRRRHLY